MKTIIKFALVLVLGIGSAIAEEAAVSEGAAGEDKPYIMANRTMTMNAVVDAVDHETREVTLTGEGGSVTFTASPDVRNLAQVEAGDSVIAEYHEQVTISVHANPEGIEPGTGEFMAEARAEAGAMPGAGVMDTVIITAVVEEINIEANTFKLRGPEGNINEFVARDPENLKKASVGDLVVITITQAVGVLVEHPEGS